MALLFNSYTFIFLYLPFTLIGYFVVANIASRYCQNEGKRILPAVWMVIMSLVFYSYWDMSNLPILICSILLNYLFGKYLEYAKSKIVLCLGVALNISLLAYYKYANFFLENIYFVVGETYSFISITLPLGISFFTFTQIAYLVDVYRGDTKNDSFITYCEFVTIFPHLIAGPIINHRKVMPQFMELRNYVVNYDNIALGIAIFSMGLLKKVVLADQLSPWVADVFNRTQNLSFLEAWAGALSYTYQLYFDFSGYSEMAFGLGMMFNICLPINFNSPYQSCSIIDFWRRWHISLGDWVKNYIYIPLGGNRNGRYRKLINLFLAMLIMGLWHGAGWTFVAWGGLHGSLLIINHVWRQSGFVLPQMVNWGLTFLSVLVCWVFFRAESFVAAGNILRSMTDVYSFSMNEAYWHLSDDMEKVFAWLICLTFVLLLVKNPIEIAKRFSCNKKWFVCILLILFYSIMRITLFSEFLYFQF